MFELVAGLGEFFDRLVLGGEGCGDGLRQAGFVLADGPELELAVDQAGHLGVVRSGELVHVSCRVPSLGTAPRSV